MTTDLYCCTTESLVLQEHTKFYPLEIPVPHHQLRHFISTSEQNHIYYVNRYDTYVLNLRSAQRSLIATLPFDARCLAADHGWLCIGGEEKGDCAFIKIERHEPRPALQERGEVGLPKCFGHELIVKELGGDIVNAMKVQKLYHENDLNCFELVVLISNNDKTVKIYSLDRQMLLTTLEHSVAINYAALSPDSRILVTVGDANNIYFYRRTRTGTASSSGNDSPRQPEYEWVLMGTPAIPVNESALEDWSFSVIFSPCGRLCAVSSQGGTISVFDMECIDEFSDTETIESAVICAFKSSREPPLGCVRSMAFSPEPWGLLAWAEDHGRVGIADVRQFCVRRQIMKLDSSLSNVTKIETEDKTPSKYKSLGIRERLKQQHELRLRMEHRFVNSSVRAEEAIANAWSEESRTSRQERRELLSYHHGLELDARERSVVDAVETTMDDVQQTMTPPAEDNYHTSSLGSGAEASNPHLAGRPSSSDSDADELGLGEDTIPRQQIGTRDEQQSGSPRENRPYRPRRRTSIVISSSSATLAPPRDLSRNRLTASPSPIPQPTDENAYSDLPPPMSTNDLTPSRNTSSQPLPYNIPSSESLILPRPQTPPTGRYWYSSVPPGYPQHERHAMERRYEGDPEFEADLEAHLAAFSANYGLIPASSSSAETSTLPTTHTARDLLRRHRPDDARRRLYNTERLQREVRRTGNRAATASQEIEAIENAIINSVNGERHARILEARVQSRLRAADAANVASASLSRTRPTGTTIIARDLERLRHSTMPSPQAQAQTQPSVDPPPARRIADLSSRASPHDIRLARDMIVSGAMSRMDRNGNWVASAHQVQTETRPQIETEGATVSLMEEALRSNGPGTAGVGWSPDGRFLYAGTERGVFEYAINLRDRMQFPACEMR